MNHLIIFAHPNSHSFNKAILDKVIIATQQQHCQVQIRDLYRLNFNPVLSWEEITAAMQQITPIEIQREQQFIRDADLITLIYPLWWMGFPAILKGYLDRILTHGFAYKTEKTGSVGLIQNKKMQHFITIGNNVEAYQKLGFTQSIQDCLVNGLFNYCGITDIQHTLFGDIHLLDDNGRQQLIEQAGQITSQNLTALLNTNNADRS